MPTRSVPTVVMPAMIMPTVVVVSMASMSVLFVAGLSRARQCQHDDGNREQACQFTYQSLHFDSFNSSYDRDGHTSVTIKCKLRTNSLNLLLFNVFSVLRLIPLGKSDKKSDGLLPNLARLTPDAIIGRSN